MTNSNEVVNVEKPAQVKPAKKKPSYKVCAVATCHNPQDLRYHYFPTKSKKDLRQKWICAVKRGDKRFNPDNARVCERHFSPVMVKRDLQHELLNKPLRFLLNPGAFPDQNLPRNVETLEIGPESGHESQKTAAPRKVPDSSKAKNYSHSCAVVSCKNPGGITYHEFPKSVEVSNVWISKCGRPPDFKVKGKKVCAEHFREEDYFMDGFRGKVLKVGSIPSLKLKIGDPTPEVNDVRNEGNNIPDVIEYMDMSNENILDVTNEVGNLSERTKRKVRKDHLRMANDVLLAEAKESKENLEVEKFILQQENNNLKDQHSKDQEKIKALEASLAKEKVEKKLLQTQNSRLRRVADKSKVIKKKVITSKVKEVLSKRMSPGNVKMYLNPEQKWVRYSTRDKVEALVLGSISKKSYKQLRRFNQLTLPHVRTLQRWLADFDCRPGFQEDAIRVVTIMKEKTELPHYELSALTFDEMDLKKNRVAIDMKYQRVYGPNNKAQTVMIRGLLHG